MHLSRHGRVKMCTVFCLAAVWRQRFPPFLTRRFKPFIRVLHCLLRVLMVNQSINRRTQTKRNVSSLVPCANPTVMDNRIYDFPPLLLMLSAVLLLSIDSVVISLSKGGKHELPVYPTCVWWHRNGIMDRFHEDGIACPTVGGRPVGNYSDVLGCMAEADCVITGIQRTRHNALL